MVRALARVLHDERGMSMVETLIITACLAGTAVLALSAYRGGASNAASIVQERATSVFSNETSW